MSISLFAKIAIVMTSKNFEGRLNSLNICNILSSSWPMIRAIYMFAIVTTNLKRVGRAEKNQVASRSQTGREQVGEGRFSTVM